MQDGTNAQSPDAATLRAQIREQVRQQVQSAREQARAAQQQAGQQGGGTSIEVPTPNGPVVVVRPPGSDGDIFIPPRAESIAIEFFVMVVAIFFVVPIARALARRIDKKPVPSQLDTGLVSQLQRIENTVDSMSIEIERISEAQRYMARLQSERGEQPALVPKQTAS